MPLLFCRISCCRTLHRQEVRRTFWAQFHQHSNGSFYASILEPILMALGVEHDNWEYFLAKLNSKVVHIFVGETEQLSTHLRFCVISLVKLTPEGKVFKLFWLFHPPSDLTGLSLKSSEYKLSNFFFSREKNF
jgi:hypothetical protein